MAFYSIERQKILELINVILSAAKEKGVDDFRFYSDIHLIAYRYCAQNDQDMYSIIYDPIRCGISKNEGFALEIAVKLLNTTVLHTDQISSIIGKLNTLVSNYGDLLFEPVLNGIKEILNSYLKREILSLPIETDFVNELTDFYFDIGGSMEEYEEIIQHKY